LNIVEAMDDPALFGPWFHDPSWRPWRAFLAAMFGLPMDDEALALYRACTGRTDAPNGPFTEADLIVGRRGGKSRILALLGTFLATCRDYSPFLAPGEQATVAIIAADRKQARVILRYITGMLRAVGMLAGLIDDERAESIELSNRVTIEIATASLRTTRGYSFAAVLADESAFWRSDDTAANPDHEIFRAMRPGMATIPGAILLNGSSPYRKRGELYKAYARHYGKDDGRVLVWKAPTLIMNPSLDPSIVEEAFLDDPDAALSEYGAEFRADLTDFVDRSVVDAATMIGRKELMPMRGARYVGFVDPSGGSSDSMTLAIAHAADDVSILDAIREVKPPFSPEAVVKEFAALLRSFGLHSVTGDRYAGEWPRERFRVWGINYDLSERTKGQIYLDALPMLNSGKLELLDHRVLRSQLCALERRTARGGRDSIDHPPGGHDDVANAAMGALLNASGNVRGRAWLHRSIT
jgi:hypothetical protein